jgi:hypothetical protein
LLIQYDSFKSTKALIALFTGHWISGGTMGLGGFKKNAVGGKRKYRYICMQ